MKRFYLIPFLCFLLSCKNETNNSIKIAVNLPLTGYLGVYGQRMQLGMNMAMDDLDSLLKEQGIVITFDYQDNRGETKDAITIYNKQKIQNPDVYMSGITPQTMAILDQTRNQDILHFLWSWTPLYLSKKYKEFRPWLNFGTEAQMFIDFVVKNAPQRIAYVHVDNIGSKMQEADVVVPALKKQFPDMEIFIEEYPSSMTDFKNVIYKVKQLSPDVLILNGYKESIINMIKYIDLYEINRNTIYCSMDLLEAKDEVAPTILEGLHVSAPIFDLPSKQTNKTKQWIDKFKNRYNRTPVYTEAYGYDCIMSIYEAILITRKKNISLSKALHEISFNGVTGHVSYSNVGDIENHLNMAVFKNGVLVIE